MVSFIIFADILLYYLFAFAFFTFLAMCFKVTTAKTLFLSYSPEGQLANRNVGSTFGTGEYIVATSRFHL